MKHKRILFVSPDKAQVTGLQSTLTAHNVSFTLHVAENGTDALSMMMGSSTRRLENYASTGKIQPDILLIDGDTPETEAAQMLALMQKYYSLQKIKSFVLFNDPSVASTCIGENCKVNGLIRKPLNFSSTEDDIERLKSELNVNVQMGWLPLLLTPFSAHELTSLPCRIASTVMQRVSDIWAAFGLKAVAAMGTVAVGLTLGSSAGTLQPQVAELSGQAPVSEIVQPSAVAETVEDTLPEEPKIAKKQRRKTPAAEIKPLPETKIAASAHEAAPEVNIQKGFSIQVVEESFEEE